MIEINTQLLVFILLAGIITMELTKHVVAYFWRMLTKKEKFLIQQDLQDWCEKCDSKKNNHDNNRDIVIIKRLLVKLSIKAGISENEIAELTQ